MLPFIITQIILLYYFKTQINEKLNICNLCLKSINTIIIILYVWIYYIQLSSMQKICFKKQRL